MHKIQYISQGETAEEHFINCKNVLEAGGEWIQLRMKNFSVEEVKETALKVQLLCKEFEAIFILNDNVQLTNEIDADGVHLGLSDTPISKAIELFDENKIIGGTANSYEDVVQRINEGCDYIGLGPFRFTKTKVNLSPVLGLEGYKALIDRLTEAQLRIPIIAIGGIEIEDISSILLTGIQGVALSGALSGALSTKENMDTIKSKIYEQA